MARKKTSPKQQDDKQRDDGLLAYAAGNLAAVAHAGEVYPAQDGIIYLPNEPWAREYAADNGLTQADVPVQPALVE